jgi:hypothetical protein
MKATPQPTPALVVVAAGEHIKTAWRVLVLLDKVMMVVQVLALRQVVAVAGLVRRVETNPLAAMVVTGQHLLSMAHL